MGYNGTGSDRGAGEVVGIQSPGVDSSNVYGELKREVTIYGCVPTASHVAKFGITMEPIAARTWGPICIAGACPAKVYVTDTDHDYAAATAGVTGFLTSGTSGAAFILWKEAGTGTKWAIVRLVAPSSGGWPTVFLLGGLSYNSDGSNRNLIKGYGDGYSSDNRMGYVFFDYQYGDASGAGLSIVTNKTSVDSGSNAETSALFSLSLTGLYKIDVSVGCTDETTIPAATSSNVTSSTDSIPSHNHTVARLTDVQYQSNMAGTLQSRLGAGAWSSISGWTGTTMYTRTGASNAYRYELYVETMLIAVSTASKEYRLRLSTAIYPQLGLAASTDHAERSITTVHMAISRVDDDPAVTNL
jgi:hypothetical protein